MAADARSQAIEGHLPLVRSVARRYAASGEPFDDLVQVGTIGLIKAVDRFDPRRDRDLAALARPAIEGEIRHHLRDRTGALRVPRTDHELAGRLRAVATELTARERRAPTPAEVAAAAGVDEQRAARALAAMAAAEVHTLDDDGARAPAANGELDAAEARALLDAGWEVLDERDRRMLELRFREDRSQAEIARDLGLSQAHVSRLLRAAVERLRREVGGPPEEPPEAPSVPQTRPRSGRLLLRVPQSLHTAVAHAAEREGVPVNTFIAGTLAGAVGWHDAEGAALATAEQPADAAPGPAPVSSPPSRARTLLLVNAVVVTIAALAGIALLLAAWLG